MAFVSAMSLLKRRKLGVNGEEVLTETGVGDGRVSLFTMLVRGLEDSYIESAISAAPEEHLEDYVVMAFQLRDIRGGKGERDLFQVMIKALYKRAPKMVESLVDLIPEYGCWRDLWDLFEIVGLRAAILNIVRQQWIKDIFATNKSLLAKWLPREKSKTWPELVPHLAAALFSHMPPRTRLATYRKEVAKRNRALGTSEINMCGKTWSEIDPAHVPGRSLKIHNAAFLNQKLAKGRGSAKRTVLEKQRSADPDRVECRTHFLEHIADLKAGKVAAKGANVIQPHEIVRDILQSSKDGQDLLQAQWDSIRNATAELGGLDKVVPMCDFSGSMAGLPLLISLALGVLISEVAHPAFRDHILTFDSSPQWHSFVGKTRLVEKIQGYHKMGQGLSTDFYKACMQIVQRMEAARVPVGEEPEDLIVLTDMGWDQARCAAKDYDAYLIGTNPWKSQIARIHEEFAAASKRVWGDGPGWRVPRIVIWNLRAAYKDFHAAAADEGVVMISGWSPNILKALQKGAVKTTTPYEGMRAVLDDPRYDAVRTTVRTKIE